MLRLSSVVVWLAACSQEPLPDFSAAGPYAPGTLESSVVGRSDVELAIQAWYPSDEPAGDAVRYDGLIGGGATEDLAAACDTPRPVLVFSHGYGGTRWQSYFWMEHLAYHGYVVVAPDHTYNTLFDLEDDRFLEVAWRRPEDVADAFDWAVAESARAGSPLAGCVDEAAGYAVAGHSFGGYTTYAVAGARLEDPAGGTRNLGDPRVWAAVALAPWDADGLLTTGTSDIEVPVMTLSGTLDTTTDWEMVSGLHDALTVTPRYLGELPTAGHFSFAPVSCTFEQVNGCGEGFLDLDDLERIVNTSGLAFLEEARGQEGAIDQLSAGANVTWTRVE